MIEWYWLIPAFLGGVVVGATCLLWFVGAALERDEQCGQKRPA